MIRYDLECDQGHSFESWFRDSGAFDLLSSAGEVTCTICGSANVQKQLLTPGVPAKANRRDSSNQKMISGPDNAEQRQLMDAVRQLRKQVTENADYVGQKFPEEARKMHYGEADERGIYGEASVEEATELLEEGVRVSPLPKLPEDAN